ALPLTSKCGDWIRATPRTPMPAANQTVNEGRTWSKGQDRNATQIGKVFVSVNTSAVGSAVKAKNVQSKLMLLAQPRSQRAPGRRKAGFAPASFARLIATRNATHARTSAMTRQSHVSFKR